MLSVCTHQQHTARVGPRVCLSLCDPAAVSLKLPSLLCLGSWVHSPSASAHVVWPTITRCCSLCTLQYVQEYGYPTLSTPHSWLSGGCLQLLCCRHAIGGCSSFTLTHPLSFILVLLALWLPVCIRVRPAGAMPLVLVLISLFAPCFAALEHAGLLW